MSIDLLINQHLFLQLKIKEVIRNRDHQIVEEKIIMSKVQKAEY